MHFVDTVSILDYSLFSIARYSPPLCDTFPDAFDPIIAVVKEHLTVPGRKFDLYSIK